MPERVDLRQVLGLAPAQAVEFFRSKGYAITFSWDAMDAEAHARAFTVAKAANMDVLTAIRTEVDRAIAEGISFGTFRKNLEPRLKALGWWGKQVMERPDGTAQIVQTGSPHRLRTIYQTNLQSAYMAGRHRAMMDNAQARPYWQYVAVMDLKTRPAHAALHARVFRFDDPIWKTCYPPNGYNCRCRVRALSARDLEAKGLAASASGDDLRELNQEDPTTGEVVPRVTYKGPGMAQPFAPDRGFVGNQALAASSSEVAIARKAEVLGGAADAALNQVATENWPAYTHWVDDVFSAGVPRGESRIVGYAHAAERSFLRERGADFSTGAFELEDRLVVGRKAERHVAQDRDLSVAEWKQLPLALASRTAVLWDPEGASFLYLSPLVGGEEALLRVVVRPGTIERERKVRDSVRSASRVRRSDVAAAVRGGRYQLVSGKV